MARQICSKDWNTDAFAKRAGYRIVNDPSSISMETILWKTIPWTLSTRWLVEEPTLGPRGPDS